MCMINKQFFDYLFGFVLILSMGMGVVLAVDYYDVSTKDIQQAATALFFLE